LTQIHSKIVSSSWSLDGTFFALGLYNGQVSVWSPSGNEIARIERGSNPIRSLCWTQSNILAVADKSQTLSFFKASGEQVGKEKVLGYDPCTISYSRKNELLILGGSNKKAHLWNAEGVELGLICEKDGSILSCQSLPTGNQVVVGSADGRISIHQLDFKTVYGIHNDQLAIRKNMVEVVIHDLSTNRKTRLKCKDYIKKIAIQKDILAIQFPTKSVIYEQFDKDGKMSFTVKEKIPETKDCDNLLATSVNLFRSTGSNLQMTTFSGKIVREWNFTDEITFSKVFGAQEGLLIGLNDGQVFKVSVDNSLTIPVLQHKLPVNFVDINANKTKLAIIDEENTCTVYDLGSKEVLYQEHYVTGVSWNTEIENSICISGIEGLTVKTDVTTTHQCRLSGYVVSFKGSNVVCLDRNELVLVEVPVSGLPKEEESDSPKLVGYNEEDDKSASSEEEVFYLFNIRIVEYPSPRIWHH
jgi:intraflagellar transport protein 122